ncbi:SDR family NAD(P)-dependent oxidoreductase [Sphingobacterium anhuiense]|uniref:SDR family NAD(P)-dependent oxidoreductase n=1 Tax=Sphingobacterium anhuiense TaxID=493780 RepID=UPI003C2E22F8
MARIFITGSSDGLGQLAAKALIAKGHQVVLHARNSKRAKEAHKKVPGAENVLIADLSSMEETKKLAAEANTLGRFDAVIHNAGVYQVSNLELSIDGFPLLLAVNTLAPYILTCLMKKPKRLVYLSSGMHTQGDPMLKGLQGSKLRATYSDSKLHDLILSKAVARKWTNVYANAVDPGWVPTKMGGKGAPDNLQKGYETQVWLAVSTDKQVQVSGHYFHHQQDDHHLKQADTVDVQNAFLALCKQITGIDFPTD